MNQQTKRNAGYAILGAIGGAGYTALMVFAPGLAFALALVCAVCIAIVGGLAFVLS
jgi:hypothetical protein